MQKERPDPVTLPLFCSVADKGFSVWLIGSRNLGRHGDRNVLRADIGIGCQSNGVYRRAQA